MIWKLMWILLFFLWPTGIEDGQTVRMPVGKKEIFITFKVSYFDLDTLCYLAQTCQNCHNFLIIF